MTAHSSIARLFEAISRHKRHVLLGGILVCCLLYWLLSGAETPPAREPRYPVRIATAERMDVPIFFKALGTATPANTAVVKSRVEGELIRLHFTEGQIVQAGDLLAEIDPRPFEVQLQEAKGAHARDAAQLKDARLTLQRYRKLIREGSVSAQDLQAQEALVGQYEGILQVDKAAIANAELQLEYARITAPIQGRAGIKKVDIGNMIRANDTDGIVTITQNDPMQVIFTLVERQIHDVTAALQDTPLLDVHAYDQQGKKQLASGTLLTLDNQIDTTTGTIKAKASFPNAASRLYPNQFVNIQLLVRTEKDALVIPTSAVQRDDADFFVYVVQPAAPTQEKPQKQRKEATDAAALPQKNVSSAKKTQGTVYIRKIATGYKSDTVTIVTSGLEPGELVVIDGVDRLRDQALISF